MKKKLLLPLIIVQAIMMYDMAYERGIITVGGEWFIVPLYIVVVYGLIPSIKQLFEEVYKDEAR
ncbi:hypothetical protein CS063_01375 [Sporanaerobium hydrogeniformans]|uniref:Uncharacterized protein n=1 Tax=Sporanaerobium hydrogeniformans TaxID=3072179 RepID=A0AC61DG02_9FIRM|nr:hypothetical protein [Sporanaerobium hydrogeniformans]PHV72154.1 hypothetical protein CS063_01375 [Sporanaerobium hydrogeniformans]